jgi:anti-sigma regulatory factor (Ser/Thr protein kinase)
MSVASERSSATSEAPGMTAGIVHDALLYHNPVEYLAGTVGFVEAGLARGEPVLVAVPSVNLSLLRDALGSAAGRVELQDMCRIGRKPGRILPGVLLAFARAHRGQPIRIIGEPIWDGRSELEYPACVQHEALINTAFARSPVTIRCPYDVSVLDRRVIDDAGRTHPLLVDLHGQRPSGRYADPVGTAADFNLPLPAPPGTAETIPVSLATLAGLRRFVADHARAAGLAPARVADATIAVNELLTNTVGHANGDGTLACWHEDGQLVCQVSDRGHIADPMAGRLPPAVDSVRGRGLFLVNQLCDLVRVHTGPGRTTIRVQVGP